MQRRDNRPDVYAGKQQQNTKQKTILDTPFVFEWPSLSALDSSSVLDTLLPVLSFVGTHRASLSSTRRAHHAKATNKSLLASKLSDLDKVDAALAALETTTPKSIEEKLRKENEKKSLIKKRKSLAASAKKKDQDVTNQLESNESDVVHEEPPEVKQVMQSLVIGINSIANELQNDPSSIRAVLVCKSDSVPTQMYAHLPMLTYLAGPHIRLLPLPTGSEVKLAEALGLRSVIAVAIKTNTPLFDPLLLLVESLVKPPSIPWLPRKLIQSATFGAGAAAVDAALFAEVAKDVELMKSRLKTLNIPDGKRGSGGGGRGGRGGGRGGKNDRNQEMKQKPKEVESGEQQQRGDGGAQKKGKGKPQQKDAQQPQKRQKVEKSNQGKEGIVEQAKADVEMTEATE
ncbi:hypothetical protein HDU98_009865 [Podochytrium sp. JEL0797]|nr:hypothetical protein HDU98_009865 [Podochytrium sp. JEL0797]